MTKSLVLRIIGAVLIVLGYWLRFVVWDNHAIEGLPHTAALGVVAGVIVYMEAMRLDLAQSVSKRG
jgi:hypothetical protein